MLKKILNPSSCAECRVCCGFDREDVWEIPIISKELAEYIKSEVNPDVRLDKYENGYKFHMDFCDGEELSMCPMLSDNGCILKDNKPFDCRVWPMRVMRLSDNLVGITVSPVCETVSALPLSVLSDFLLGEEGLADKMLDYAEKNPEIIKPYIDGYPILKIKEM